MTVSSGASKHQQQSAAEEELSPAALWNELTRDLMYGLFASRLADAHAARQPATFAYRSCARATSAAPPSTRCLPAPSRSQI